MEHREFYIENPSAGTAPESTAARRRANKGKKKKKVESILWYLIPFVVLNILIFRYMTAQPDFTLLIEDPENFQNVSLTVETQGRLKPQELSVRLDDVPVEMEHPSKNIYTAELDRNGTLEVVMRYPNGMSRTQYEHISTIDDQPPIIIGEELDGAFLTVSFEDAQSGVDYSTIYALDADGNRVAPERILEEEQSVILVAETDSLEVHASDFCGNEAVASFTGLKLKSNSSDSTL